MRPLKITQSITNRETPSFEKYLQEVSKLDLITPEREVELARLIKSGSQKAMNELVNSNLRFVISVAKQYAGRGMSVEDLVSEGNIGLIKAAEKWDETRGIKFISYAVWWIRQSILQSLADNSRSIRLPLNQINSLNKINSAFAQLEQEFGRTPTIYELSEYLQIEEEKIELSLTSSKKITSLDLPVGEEEDFTLLDTISSDEMADDLINKIDLNSSLMYNISKLSDKEQKVIINLFGIGVYPKTPNELAMEMDITSERVRQIKNGAVKKLQFFGVNY
jgi:RNA polymerase primary sigma factor